MIKIEKENVSGLEKPFLHEEAVTGEKIQDMVDMIKSNYIKDFSIERRRIKLVENLSLEHIAKVFRDDGIEFDNEVAMALQKIRERIIYKLLLDPEIDERDIYFITKDKTKKSYEFQHPKEYDLEGDYYYREFNPASHSTARGEALNKLMPLLKGQPCPYVSSLQEHDYSSRIVKRKNMTDLKRLLSSKDIETSKIELKTLLKYLLDAIKGAQYLSEKGFVLEDLHLENIGIDKEKDIGVLFDYDCLYLKGEMLKGRRIHYKHMPPESKSIKIETPTTEAEMVFQLGVCLKRILERFIEVVGLKRVNEQIDVEDLLKISVRMTNEKPEERGTLKQVISELEPLVVAA